MNYLKFCKKIGLIEEVSMAVMDFPPLLPDVEKAFIDNPETFVADSLKRPDANLYMLGFYLRFGSKYGVSNFIKKGYSEEIAIDTMRDIALWSEVYFSERGEIGIAPSEARWLMQHMFADIVTLGRLQFKPTKLDNDIVIDGHDTLKKGSVLIEVHIPRGGPLDKTSVESAFASADRAFNNPVQYSCYSWMLSPVLDQLLKPESNLIHFKNLFRTIEVFEKNSSAMQYINFSIKKFGASSLSRGAYRLKDAGLEVGAAFGIYCRQ